MRQSGFAFKRPLRYTLDTVKRAKAIPIAVLSRVSRMCIAGHEGKRLPASSPLHNERIEYDKGRSPTSDQ